MYNKSLKEVLETFDTTVDGISQEEADRRLKNYGENKLPEGKKTPLIVKFLKQFTDVMILVLLVAAVISLVVAIMEQSSSELIDAIVIFAIVFFNAILGFVQELKAENALESLKKMSQPYANIIRDGKNMKVKTTEIVIGDIVLVEAGDVVPADMYLIEATRLKCDEASLTGESNPLDKEAGVVLPDKTPLADRRNMCYSSSTVVYGKGKGVVVAVGKDAEIGKIASMLSVTQKEVTPLEQSLNKLGKFLTILVLGIAVVVFFVGMINHGTGSMLDSFLTAVAIAVAAIPESLPAVVTIILSIGVTKLARKNVIIRQLHAVETLGCCEVICSDKTGTITQNRMTVKGLYTDGKSYTDENYAVSGVNQEMLLNCMMLCNDARAQDATFVGDPTETALWFFAEKLAYNKADIDKKNKRIGEFPFDSERKLMTTINKNGDEVVQYTKGAIDQLLERCKFILKKGEIKKFTAKDKEDIMAENAAMCGKALRVLGYAYKVLDVDAKTKKISSENIEEKDLVFIGCTGMIDPPRLEVYDAIKKCRKAGMRPVMITGDHKDTAYAIAKELGIVSDKKEVVDGAFLDQFTDAELCLEVRKFSVYTRVTPEHKVRIVNALKNNGNVVAMTGDGVNDAPSIKSADIGIGMGITGTEVTKEVADMVLTDDNFATIVVAVEEGRKIYSNIQKTVKFLLGSNIAEVLTLLICTIAFPSVAFLSAVQILFINLVSDSLPAIALGMEEADKDIMDVPPRKKNENIVGGRHLQDIVFTGVVMTALVIGSFVLSLNLYGSLVAATVGFYVLDFLQLFQMYNVHTNGSIFKKNIFKNKTMTLAFLFGVSLMLLVSFVPFLREVFGLELLNINQWLIVIAFSIVLIPIFEVKKLIESKLKK